MIFTRAQEEQGCFHPSRKRSESTTRIFPKRGSQWHHLSTRIQHEQHTRIIKLTEFVQGCTRFNAYGVFGVYT